jgi:hypothetical protein
MAPELVEFTDINRTYTPVVSEQEAEHGNFCVIEIPVNTD